MAIFRNVQMSFWTDADVIDDYTPDDRYFYLYLLTNPHTNLCGCYELSIAQAAIETGLDKKKVSALIDRAVNDLQSICYSKETKEILIIKWSKYNWTESEKFRKPLFKEIQSVKNGEFKQYLTDLYNGIDTVSPSSAYGIDTVSPSKGYGIDTTVTDTVTDTDTDTVSVTDTDTVSDSVTDTVTKIVDYLNNECDTNYKPTTEGTRKLIKARLKEGYTLEDFCTVISKKAKEWRGTDQEKYLRPETLFGNKFESYLNQQIRGPANKSLADKWMDALKIAEGG